jgi:RHS repeat-associated protein
MTSIAYPNAGPTYNFTYDSLSRLNGMTQSGSGTLVNNITYGPAGELLDITYLGYNEHREYNERLQLTRLKTNNGAVTDFEYRFPSAGVNNGQLWQMKDWVTGEEVTYAYDSLSRLTSATTTGPEWGQSYGYDGFGNLLSQTVTKGTAPYMSVAVNPANNRVVGTTYDNNGNDLTFGSYDVANRLKQTGSGVQYGYAPDNKRVWKKVDSNPANDEFYFWSGNQRLGTYKSSNPGNAAFTTASTNVYFGGRLIQAAGTAVLIDRLGSNVTGGKRYFPYGQEKPSATTNNVEKFTGYFRDSETGLDYADQRYHNPGMGRFLTPDPAGSGPNWYAYVGGDPMNSVDPSGLLSQHYVSCPAYRGMAMRQEECDILVLLQTAKKPSYQGRNDHLYDPPPGGDEDMIPSDPGSFNPVYLLVGQIVEPYIANGILENWSVDPVTWEVYLQFSPTAIPAAAAACAVNPLCWIGFGTVGYAIYVNYPHIQSLFGQMAEATGSFIDRWNELAADLLKCTEIADYLEREKCVKRAWDKFKGKNKPN